MRKKLQKNNEINYDDELFYSQMFRGPEKRIAPSVERRKTFF